MILSEPPSLVEGAWATYAIELEPRERWELVVDVVPSPSGEVVHPHTAERRFGEELQHVRDSLTAWQLRVPQLRADWDDLERAVSQSISDLAALRIRAKENGRVEVGRLPAAGMPWFMTVFGRDSIVTGLQTLLLGPELARSVLEELAELQATEDDPELDAEPGKIVHEVRRGKASESWFARYYGTVDATPLYLVLLSEVWRWTGRHAARDDAPRARHARARVDRPLRRPRRRRLRRVREALERGLDNQSWKDSHDSQRFADGRVAEPPIAPCEVQGYVFDAKQRMAEIAREAWRDRELGDRLDREAKELRRAFNDAYWVEERGGYYALALDRRQASRRLHVLEHGPPAVERHRALRARRRCRRPADGRGAVVGLGRAHDVVGRRRVQPARVPQRHSLATRQFADRPRPRALPALAEAQKIVQRMLEAAAYLDHQLPEVFAGHATGGDAVPHRVSDRRAAAGVGGGGADPPVARAARARAVAPAADAGDGRAGGAAVVGGIAAAGGRAVLRPALDGARRQRPRQARAGMKASA